MVVAMSLLLVAITLEVAATSSLKRTDGFTDPLWTAGVLLTYAASIWLLALVVRLMPVSVAYAIWSGLGTAMVAVVGHIIFSETLGWIQVLCLAMIVFGVIGLNLFGSN